MYHISFIPFKSLTKVLASYWALLTLLWFLGPFCSEGKMFQRISKPHQESRETKRWLPLSADPTHGAQKDSELANQKKDHLTLAFADHKLTKKRRDGDYKRDDILKRRHGFSQVDIHSIKQITFALDGKILLHVSKSCLPLCTLQCVTILKI